VKKEATELQKSNNASKFALLKAFNGGVSFSSLAIQSLGNTNAERTRCDDIGLPCWPSELQLAEKQFLIRRWVTDSRDLLH
jgi:hypothetical protein